MTSAVPHSAGLAAPRLKAPPEAADCHLHVYDPAYPMAWPKLRAITDASVEQYRLLQRRLGMTRAVIVQPAPYGTDNRGIVDAIAALGADHARGVAVLHPGVTDAELDVLHAAGIRGIRFSMHDPKTAVTSPDMILPLAARISERGWHVQLHLKGEQIVDLQDTIEQIPCGVVFDHMARLPQPAGVRHFAFEVVARRLEAGNGWVKLSGAYLDSRVGAPRYADATRVAREWVKIAPERLVWGSDWPHPTEQAKPDDAVLFDLVQEWARDETTRRRILVENPAVLYGF